MRLDSHSHEVGSGSRVDEARRTIYLVGTVDEGMLVTALEGLRTLAAKKGPIHIVLTSCGGGVDEGFAIYDAIVTTPRKVIIDVLGFAQSIATLILQAATERRLGPEARVMVHDGSLGVDGVTVKQYQAIGREAERLHNRYCEILAQRSGLELAKVKAMCSRETYMSAGETINQGLADSMLSTFNPSGVSGRVKARRRR